MLNTSFINYKISSVNPVFDGTKTAFLIDKEKAIEYYAQTKPFVQRVKYDVDAYGGIISVCELPIRTPASEPITAAYLQELKWLRWKNIITDFAFWFWDLWITRGFDIFREEIDGIEVYFFYPKKRENKDLYGMSHAEIVDLLVLREFLEWKFLADVPWLPKKLNIPTQTIKLETLGISVPFNYTVAMRYTMTKDWKRAQQNWKSYPTSAYFNWLSSGRVHALTGSRRYWKTRYSVPEIKAELLNIQFAERPKKIVYVAPSDARLWTMRRYLANAFKNEVQMWLVSRMSSEDNMVFWKFDEQGNKMEENFWEIQLYSAQADDVWVGDYYDVCFLDEIERISKRNENVLSDLLSVATNEFGYFRLISTINKQWEYTDFIKYLQLWEEKKVDYKEFFMGLWFKYGLNKLDIAKLEKKDPKEMAKLMAIPFPQIKREIMFYMDYTSMRVPWDNVETYTSEEKSQIKRMLLKEWILSYVTERLCQLPEEIQSQEFEQQIVDHSFFQDRKRDHILMNYDVADKVDKGAVTFLGYNKEWTTLEFFKEIELVWDINQQYDALTHIYRTEARKYTKSDKQENVHLVYDHRGMGTGLRPLFDRDKIPVVCFESTNWSAWWRDDRKYTVGKNYAHNLLKFNIASGHIIISNLCTNFIDEYKHFKETVTDKGYSKFAAQSWHHDDFVTSLLMWNRFAMDVLWAKYTLTKKVVEEVVIPNDVALFWDMHDNPKIKEEETDLYDLFWY